MGQLSIYLPDEVEKRLRRNAKRARKSVSAYIAQLETSAPQRETVGAGHPAYILELCGSIPGLKAPPDQLPEIPDLGPALPDRHGRVRRVSRKR